MDIDPLSTIPRPVIPEKYLDFGDNLLDRLLAKKGDSKRITLQEFLKECTYFMLQCGFNEIRPLPLPTKPTVLAQYEDLTEFEKKKVSAKLFEDDQVQEYIRQRTSIIWKNKSNLAWLKENLARLEEYGDAHYAQVVRNRIQEFEDNPPQED